MKHFSTVLAQTDSTDQRVQMIILGLMIVAAAFALLAAWYWRVTDPRRRTDPQPAGPGPEDKFIPVEVKPEKPRKARKAHDAVTDEEPGQGPDGEGGADGPVSTPLPELTGDVTILRERPGPTEIDLREPVDSALPVRPLAPLPPRPSATEDQVAPLPEGVEDLIDLREPAPKPERGADTEEGLSVDEWLSLQGD